MRQKVPNIYNSLNKKVSSDFLPPVLHCYSEIRVFPKIRALPSGTVHITPRPCCQQNRRNSDGQAYWPHLRRSTQRRWTVDGGPHTKIYYTSVDRNALTSLHRFVVDLLYNLFLQFCSSWQDFNWDSRVARSICGSRVSCSTCRMRGICITAGDIFVLL